jgi:hypothetical protein
VKRFHRVAAVVITILICVVLLHRMPLSRLIQALQQADYPRFLAAMIPNTLFYFLWDTLVLTVVIRWFHGPVRYRDLLPVRAASYVVAFFNTNAGRGALAVYLAKRLQSPFLQLGSTVLFLVVSEYLHLVAWATIGITQIGADVPRELWYVPPIVAAAWLALFAYTRLGSLPSADDSSDVARGPLLVRWVLAPRRWALMRTFRLAPARRYAQIIALRAPMFFVSFCLHYAAARAFGLSIPLVPLLAFLPIIFMIAALPITVARLGTTQVAWLFFFSGYADPPRLLAFSLSAHLTFVVTRALLGLLFLPRAYGELVKSSRVRESSRVLGFGAPGCESQNQEPEPRT